MNGPENYSAAERLLLAADEYEAEGDPQTANARRSEATARAILALTASHATAQHPESVAWDQAINQQEHTS
ncbi:hypothetical protein ACFXKY_08070 [Streptomyces canus]|uniref:hypothetical protein n=1 Tax=Streptomyces canus TaxID=58343 RepID=UPI0036CA466F